MLGKCLFSRLHLALAIYTWSDGRADAPHGAAKHSEMLFLSLNSCVFHGARASQCLRDACNTNSNTTPHNSILNHRIARGEHWGSHLLYVGTSQTTRLYYIYLPDIKQHCLHRFVVVIRTLSLRFTGFLCRSADFCCSRRSCKFAHLTRSLRRCKHLH